MKQLQLFYKEERRFFFSLFLLMLVNPSAHSCCRIFWQKSLMKGS